MLTKRERALTFLVKSHNGATVTVLMKLAYLIDLVSCKRTNKTIFGYSYKRYFYGPFDNKIYNDVENLQKQDILIGTSEYIQESRDEYIFYTFNVKKEEFDFGLSKGEKAIINEILKSLEGLGAKMLTEIAYKTKPMQKLKATLGGNENLGVLLDLTAN